MNVCTCTWIPELSAFSNCFLFSNRNTSETWKQKHFEYYTWFMKKFFFGWCCCCLHRSKFFYSLDLVLVKHSFSWMQCQGLLHQHFFDWLHFFCQCDAKIHKQCSFYSLHVDFLWLNRSVQIVRTVRTILNSEFHFHDQNCRSLFHITNIYLMGKLNEEISFECIKSYHTKISLRYWKWKKSIWKSYFPFYIIVYFKLSLEKAKYWIK